MPSPSPRAQEHKPVPAGFSLPLDIVVAPGRAFLKIAQTSEWLPGVLVIVLMGAASTALTAKPLLHVLLLEKVQGPPLTIVDAATITAFYSTVAPLLIATLLATFVTVLMRLKDPTAPYFRALSLSVNCMVPSVLGTLVHSVAAVVREPWSISSLRAFYLALPDTLGALAAPGSDREFDFLVRFSAWDAWSFVLLGFGISLFTGMRFSTALIISAALYFLTVALYPS